MEEVIIIDDPEETREESFKEEERVPTNGKIVKLDHVTYRNECVSLHDYMTLLPDVFLNDSIVNFYLTFIHDTKLDKQDRQSVHIFSSHFFSKLKSGSSSSRSGGRCPRLLAHDSVRRWTKRVNIFCKRFVLVPICEDEHWYLIVVVNPGHAFNELNHVVKGNPYFLVLDSVGDRHSAAVTTLRSYLLHEYWTKVVKTKEKPKSPFGPKKMKHLQPKDLPLQDNSSDCGIFLLQYAETILLNLGKFFWSNHVEQQRVSAKPLDSKTPTELTNGMDEKWFSEEIIRNKRLSIALILQELANANPNTRDLFPDISEIKSDTDTYRWQF